MTKTATKNARKREARRAGGETKSFKMPDLLPCAECGASDHKLTNGAEIYPHRPELAKINIWKCKCGAYVGCHEHTTRPKGAPCGWQTRKARQQAHQAFDPLWRGLGREARWAAYKWLAHELGVDYELCHIGHFNQETANMVFMICGDKDRVKTLNQMIGDAKGKSKRHVER
jgi:hypothetical protein